MKGERVFNKFGPKNIYCFGMVHCIPFPLEKVSQNYRQFVEEILKFKLLKFKNIVTRELVLDGIMRKLGLLVYFFSKKEKTK